MGVAPAGLERENAGHHHLIIDAPTPPLDRPIPNDFNHLHFGAGQSEAEVTLTPGKHVLQLIDVLADRGKLKKLCVEASYALAFPNEAANARVRTFERAQYIFDKAGCDITTLLELTEANPAPPAPR